MNASAQVLHNRVDAVLALAAARLDTARHKTVEGFAREYFRRLDAEDLAERTPEDLLGGLLSHLQLGEQRRGTLRGRPCGPPGTMRCVGPAGQGTMGRGRWCGWRA